MDVIFDFRSCQIPARPARCGSTEWQIAQCNVQIFLKLRKYDLIEQETAFEDILKKTTKQTELSRKFWSCGEISSLPLKHERISLLLTHLLLAICSQKTDYLSQDTFNVEIVKLFLQFFQKKSDFFICRHGTHNILGGERKKELHLVDITIDDKTKKLNMPQGLGYPQL
ncbi:MAG: hypothetical protein ACE5OR_07075 [bacterium]